MTLVIDGGCTFSWSASSPGVIAGCFSSADSAASWVSESTASVVPDAARWARSRLASLLTEIRSAVASPASVLVLVAVMIGDLAFGRKPGAVEASTSCRRPCHGRP